MNILAYIISTVLAAERMKPLVSFADLMKTTVSVSHPLPEVLGTGTFRASIVPGAAQAPEERRTKKPFMKVAFLGDSMIDTLGTDLRFIRDELIRIYPKTTFTLINYGVGGENIISGLQRVIGETEYLGEPRLPLISTHPDVVVIESFAYNPFSFEIGALEQHWLSLAYIIDALRANLPDTKVVIAATIAPNSKVFGDGAAGLSFGLQDKIERTRTIKQYLENAIRFAQSEHLPLADAYHPSLDSTGDGKTLYINPGDHIHYSDAGRQLFARTVADTIAVNKLLE